MSGLGAPVLMEAGRAASVQHAGVLRGGGRAQSGNGCALNLTGDSGSTVLRVTAARTLSHSEERAQGRNDTGVLSLGRTRSCARDLLRENAVENHGACDCFRPFPVALRLHTGQPVPGSPLPVGH